MTPPYVSVWQAKDRHQRAEKPLPPSHARSEGRGRGGGGQLPPSGPTVVDTKF